MSVNQGKAKATEKESSAVSVDPLWTSAAIEMADIVTAIDNASRKEIDVISTGFDSLKAALLDGSQLSPRNHPAKKMDKTSDTIAGVTPINSVNIASEVTNKLAPEVEPLKPSEITDKTSVSPTSNKRKKSKQLDLVEVPAYSEPTPSSPYFNSPPARPVNAEVDSAINPKTSPSAINPKTAPSLNEKAAMIEAGVMAAYKMDKNGRLRNETGAFASKAEQKQYEKEKAKKANNDSGEEEPEKQTSLLKKLVVSSAKLAVFGSAGAVASSLSDEDNTAKSAAGLAAGGAYFVAAKEVATMVKDVKSSLSDAGIESFGDVVDKAKEKIAATKEGIGGARDKIVNAIPMLRERAEKSQVKKETAADEKKAPKWLTVTNNPLVKLFSRSTPKPSETDKDILNATKAEAASEEQRHKESVMALGDVEEAINKSAGNGGSGGGLIGDALEFAEGRKNRKKGKRGRTGQSVNGDHYGRTGSRGRGSAYGSNGRPASSVAGGGKGLGGKVAGGALKAGGAVLSKLALPLTVAMAAYDGFQGYSDTEGQKETFNLKDGEEATTGQKAAMAAGSILSLGGLTDMFGFSGADIAKGIYTTLGGTISDGIEEVKATEKADAAEFDDPEAISSNHKALDAMNAKAVSSGNADTYQFDDIDSLAPANHNAITATNSNAITATNSNAITGTNSNAITGTNSNAITGTNSNATTATDSNAITATDSKAITVTDSKAITATDSKAITATDSKAITVKNTDTQTVNSLATAAPLLAPASMAAPSVIRQTDDIEQVEEINKLKKSTSTKNSSNSTTNSVNPQVINADSGDMVKILKSIDKRLATPPKTSQPASGGIVIPNDFQDNSHRQQANNLG